MTTNDSPRPQTLGAALAAFDGSQRALAAALAEVRRLEAERDDAREAVRGAQELARQLRGEVARLEALLREVLTTRPMMLGAFVDETLARRIRRAVEKVAVE